MKEDKMHQQVEWWESPRCEAAATRAWKGVYIETEQPHNDKGLRLDLKVKSELDTNAAGRQHSCNNANFKHR